MAIYYMDSSGIVKRYIHEIGSAWVVSITDPAIGNDIFTVRVTSVEVVSAIARRNRGGGIPSDDAATAIATFKNDWQNEYQIVEVTEALVNRAISLAETRGLRGYDAIQLAAACEIHDLCTLAGLPPLIFVSADTELNLAAISEGQMIDDPNSHP
jgi:predicted nucleic acid-binding protein